VDSNVATTAVGASIRTAWSASMSRAAHIVRRVVVGEEVEVSARRQTEQLRLGPSRAAGPHGRPSGRRDQELAHGSRPIPQHPLTGPPGVESVLSLLVRPGPLPVSWPPPAAPGYTFGPAGAADE
jgi:hypothetical protein